jgi:hypothetical protein
MYGLSIEYLMVGWQVSKYRIYRMIKTNKLLLKSEIIKEMDEKIKCFKQEKRLPHYNGSLYEESMSQRLFLNLVGFTASHPDFNFVGYQVHSRYENQGKKCGKTQAENDCPGQ